MTSRNSFFNLLKEDLHRRLWTLILSSLVFFGTFMVAFTMIVQNYVARYSRPSFNYSNAEFIRRISDDLCSDFYECWLWFALVAVVGAVICGINGFAYLHSRKQMDFYHSLPVKREKIFAVRLVNGVLIYAVPYLVGLLYSYLLCILYGVMTWEIFKAGLFTFWVHLLGYLIIYMSVVLAMMLTGKAVIAFFGTCVLNLYAPAIYGLYMVLKDSFFITSYNNSIDIEDAVRITKWFTPGGYYLSLMAAINDSETPLWPEFIGIIVLIAALVALTLWLYKKRASEKAGTSMAFKITEPIIRVMISVPVGILAGFMFFTIQYDYGRSASVLWLIFGGLLGGFLCHGIIEALYKGDIKKCLSHKYQMFAVMAAAAIIPLVFLYDIFGYDSYIPKKQDVKSMAVISNELRFGGSYYDENGWVSAVEYARENMEVTEIDAMYELAEILSEEAGKNRTNRFFGYRDYTSSSMPYDPYYAGGAEKMNYTDFIIRYTLKDGSEVIRSYEYNYYAVIDLLEQIYNDNEFKTSVHPVFSLIESDAALVSLECYTPTSGVSVKLERNVANIVKAYAEDMLSLSFDDLRKDTPIGELTVHFMVYPENGNYYEDAMSLLLYPSMTHTIALLKEQGCNVQGVQTANHIETITVNYGGTLNEFRRLIGIEIPEEDLYVEGDYYVQEDTTVYYEDMDIYYEKYGYYPPTVASPESYQEILVEFTDPAEIDEIKKMLVYRNYNSEFGPFPETEGYYMADVYFEMGTGAAYEEGIIGWTERFRFKAGQVPQFVIDRMLEKLQENVK